MLTSRQHSVLGEATDHFTQTEVEEMDIALKGAEQAQARSGDGQRGLFGSGGGNDFVSLLSQVPGMGGGLASTARDLQARSAEQDYENNNATRNKINTQFAPPPNQTAQRPPGMRFHSYLETSVAAPIKYTQSSAPCKQ